MCSKICVLLVAADLERKTNQLHSVSAKVRALKSELKRKDLALENTKNQLAAVSEEHSKYVLKSQVNVHNISGCRNAHGETTAQACANNFALMGT